MIASRVSVLLCMGIVFFLYVAYEFQILMDDHLQLPFDIIT